MKLTEEYDPRSRASRVLELAQHPDWECLKEELLVQAHNNLRHLSVSDFGQSAAIVQGWVQALNYVAEGLTKDLRARIREESDGES